MVSFTGLVVIVASLQGAPSASVPSSFEGEMAAGHKAFDRFAVDDANAAFERAVAVAATPVDKARALAWLGALRAESADFEGARARFREALRYDHNVTLPPTVSPAIHKLLQQERDPSTSSAASTTTSASMQGPATYTDQAVADSPRWALWSGGAVAALGVVVVGGGAAMGLSAVSERDASAVERFQSDAAASYQQARQNALWANVLYGAGGVLVVAGGGLAAASFLGVDE